MQNTLLVCVMNGFGHLPHIGRRGSGGQQVDPQNRREVLAFDIVHGKIMPAIVLTDFMNGDDMRMV